MDTIINYLTNISWSQSLIFFVCSFINVMLSTMKSILTVRSTKNVAAIINAVTYGFYAIVVKQLADLDIPITVVVTILTNLIGVYLSMWILDKIKKDSLWKITVTTPSENLKKIAQELDAEKIGYTYFSVTERKGVMDIYSETSKQSTCIREILKKYKVKYCITEAKHSL